MDLCWQLVPIGVQYGEKWQGEIVRFNFKDLKPNMQKMKIIASGPTTSWQIDGEMMETVTDFIFLGSKLTADGDFSHEIKRYLPL